MMSDKNWETANHELFTRAIEHLVGSERLDAFYDAWNTTAGYSQETVRICLNKCGVFLTDEDMMIALVIAKLMQ